MQIDPGQLRAFLVFEHACGKLGQPGARAGREANLVVPVWAVVVGSWLAMGVGAPGCGVAVHATTSDGKA